MHNSEPSSRSPLTLVCPVLAIALLACAAPINLRAQQTDAAVVGNGVTQDVTDKTSINLANNSGVNYSSSASSSSLNGVDADAADHIVFDRADATQPPPRRRYGRPRYNDSSHNPDGSNKYAFLIGGGFTGPLGNTYHYLNTNYAFQIGAGRNFNKNFSVVAQFDWDNFGFNGRTLYNQQSLYNYYCPTGTSSTICSQISGLDGKSHVWSFSLDPTYTIPVTENVGLYGVVGAGFYHKTANFTVPATGTYCDYYYGCYQYQANQTIDKYTSNAPGFNGGIGLTYKPSRFANERFYVEGRYIFVDNSKKTGVTAFSSTTALNNYNGNNYYPANSNRTTYTTFKAGIRF